MTAEWVAAVGLLLIPTFVLVASSARIPETKGAAQTIATEAARAAAQESGCIAARNAAERVANQVAEQLGEARPTLSYAGTDWQPGGVMKVTATVTVTGVIVPGALEIDIPAGMSASHGEPIDEYRFLDAGGC